MENFLNRHPRVNVVFPHMLFLCPHMERLDELLKLHRGMHVDLAPGIESLYSISRRRDDWLEVLHASRRQDTPRHRHRDEQDHRRTPGPHPKMLRRFLETGDEFHTPDIADELLTRYNLPFIGLDLPSTALEKIYSGNMRRLWGNKQRDVDFGTAASSAEKAGHVGVAKALRKMR